MKIVVELDEKEVIGLIKKLIGEEIGEEVALRLSQELCKAVFKEG